MASKKSKKTTRTPRCAFYVVDASGRVHGRGASSKSALATRVKNARKHGAEGVEVVELCGSNRRQALRSGLGAIAAGGISGSPGKHYMRGGAQAEAALDLLRRKDYVNALDAAVRSYENMRWAEESPSALKLLQRAEDVRTAAVKALRRKGLRGLAGSHAEHLERAMLMKERGVLSIKDQNFLDAYEDGARGAENAHWLESSPSKQKLQRQFDQILDRATDELIAQENLPNFRGIRGLREDAAKYGFHQGGDGKVRWLERTIGDRRYVITEDGDMPHEEREVDVGIYDADADYNARERAMEFRDDAYAAMRDVDSGRLRGLGSTRRAPTQAEVNAFWAAAPRVARESASQASLEAQRRMFERGRARRGVVPSVIPKSRPRDDSDDAIEAHYRNARHL